MFAWIPLVLSSATDSYETALYFVSGLLGALIVLASFILRGQKEILSTIKGANKDDSEKKEEDK